MPRPTKCGNGPAGGPGVPPLRKSRAIPGGHPHPPPSGAPVPTPFGLRPFPPPRQGESAPWKGEGLRTTARVAPTALREPCLKSGGRVRTPAPTGESGSVPPICRGRTLAGPQMYAARPGRGRALQPSTSRHLLSQARRGGGTAPAPIFHIARALWPGGNLECHSDFARR